MRRSSFPHLLVAVTSVLLVAICTVSAQPMRDVLEAKRRDPKRFPDRATAGELSVGAIYTGRTLIAGARSLLIRDHITVEVFVEPAHSNGVRISLSSLQLRLNGEKNPRLPQSPDVVAYAVRNADLRVGPRLTASAGVGDAGVVWDSRRRNTSPRFPGDPRISRPPVGTRRDEADPPNPMEEEAKLATEYAFRGGEIFEPSVGFLYFPCDTDLDKIKRIELLITPDGHEGEPAVLKLK